MHRLRVLVVDDYEEMRSIMRETLRIIGIPHVDVARDGHDALFKLQLNSYDFVISDLNMPNLCGIGLLKAIRADAGLCNLPVLMLTAENGRDRVVEAVQSGVNGYIVKPFSANTLKQKLKEMSLI